MKIEVYPVSLSFDADETTLDEVLSALNAAIEYVLERGGYDELRSVDVER